MAINIAERYKLIFAEHHYASDFRVKIFTGWCAIYAALAAVFAWVHTKSPSLTWIVALVATVITVLMWLADYRNRAALRAAKDAGAAIEQHKEAGIPTDQRFFVRLRPETCFETFVTHSRVLDFFALGMVTLLVIATWLLYSGRGQLT